MFMEPHYAPGGGTNQKSPLNPRHIHFKAAMQVVLQGPHSLLTHQMLKTVHKRLLLFIQHLMERPKININISVLYNELLKTFWKQNL